MKNMQTVTRKEVNWFFRQHSQRTCRMGGLTLQISEQACRKIATKVEKYLHRNPWLRVYDDCEFNPVEWHAKYCPNCRYYQQRKRGNVRK